MSKNVNRNVYIYINGKEVENNIRSIGKATRKLQNEIAGMKRGSKEYVAAMRELKKSNAILQKHRQQIRGVSSVWSGLKKQIAQFAALAAGALGINALKNFAVNLVERAGKLSDALQEVRKTTGLTAGEVKKLNRQLRYLNTRTARAELLKMAKIAGKLGITGRKDIMGFVKAMDILTVAMGDALGASDEVAQQMGKIIEAYGIKNIYGIEQALLKTGSAINQLGKESTANEGFIVQFTKKLAGIAPVANVSIQDVMGLGAALDALGQTVEVSGTALTKLYIQMAKNVEAFARIAKMPVEEFKRLMNEDANEALLMVLENVNKTTSGMSELTEVLGDMGTDGARVVAVMGTLANNIDFVRQQQAISREEFEKGTSALNEYNLMNENLGANLAKIGRAMRAWFVNSNFVDWIGRAADSVAKLVVKTKSYSEQLHDTQMELNVLVDTLTLTNVEEEERKRLINEIQSIYPDFLANLNEETVTNEELRKRLEEVNKQFLSNIILKQQDEEIEAKRNEQAEVWMKRFRQRQEFFKLLLSYEEEYGFKIDRNLSLQEQYDRALTEMEKRNLTRGSKYNKIYEQEKKLKEAFVEGISEGNGSLKEEFDLLQEEINQMEEARKAMMEQMKREGIVIMSNADDQKQSNQEIIESIKAKTREMEGYLEKTQYVNSQIVKYIREGNDEVVASLKTFREALKALNSGEDDTTQSTAALIEKISALGDAFAAADAKKLAGDLAELTLVIDHWADMFEIIGDQALQNPLAGLEEFTAFLGTLDSSEEKIARLQAMIEKLSSEPGNTSLIAKLTEMLKEIESDVASKSNRSGMLDFFQRASSGAETLTDIFRSLHQEESALLDARIAKMKQAGATEEQLAAVRATAAGKQAKLMRTIIRLQRVSNAATAVAVAVESALALQKALSGTAEQAKLPFPANIAAIIATAATIGSAIVAVKSMFSKIPETSQAASGGYTDVIGAQDRRRYRARMSSNFYGGYVDSSTLLVGERGREFVVNNQTLNDPVGANLVQILERIQSSPSASAAYSLSDGTPSGGVPPELIAQLASQLSQLNKTMQEGIVAQGVWDWDYFQEGQKKALDAEKRAGM